MRCAYLICKISFSLFQSGVGRLEFLRKDHVLCSGREDEGEIIGVSLHTTYSKLFVQKVSVKKAVLEQD